ncbi:MULTISPECIES: nicotinate-nucleotide--dimethylbenzimidazole phosphoribosyltransferase [Kordiimonas]|uniref:nicotinate-nucleotide--dimethylbenzimidazole phosphoribosyltransferase n=1 Tax=Kordiimonas TaxID=288021 RepID=UPI00257C9E60|nr:nicotinate-nucleotide--dimethylbenzimidazole phosphoribosyltransferase [Kordiimonas sp. UBA4487]
MLTGHPFDDLRAIAGQLPEPDNCAAKKVREALENKPLDSASGLAGLASWMARWQGTAEPTIAESHICVLASSYEGHDPSVVTGYIDATSKGAAAVNLLCVDKGIGLRAIQMAPEMPHSNQTEWPEPDCMAAVAFGMEATAAGGHILGLTDMAPGNAARALAIVMAIKGITTDDPLLELADSEVAAGARALLEDGIGAADDPLEIMRRIGGREIAAAIGALVAARSRRLAVLSDGWAAIAATAVLEAVTEGATEHAVPASADDALQEAVWARLGKKPILGVPVGGGPGCGIAMAVSVLGAASAMLGLRDQPK